MSYWVCSLGEILGFVYWVPIICMIYIVQNVFICKKQK